MAVLVDTCSAAMLSEETDRAFASFLGAHKLAQQVPCNIVQVAERRELAGAGGAGGPCRAERRAPHLRDARRRSDESGRAG